MEEEEDIKKSEEREKHYEEFSIQDLLNEINILNEKLKYLKNLLKEKRSGQNQAGKLFKK